MEDAREIKKKRVAALLLAIGMLATGTLNTLFLKFQGLRTFYCPPDQDCQVCDALQGTDCYEAYCTPVEGELPEYCIPFSQPVYQTFIMFLGELLCLVAFYVLLAYRKYAAAKQNEKLVDTSTLVGKYRFLLWIPTMCDLTATTLMNAGLLLTTTSVYQMLRGAVIVFTGIMSVLFLKRKQYAYHWVGMFIVVAGITLVGLTSSFGWGLSEDATPPAGSGGDDDVLGAVLVICAQIFTATQFVFEEKILGRFDAPPMLAIGLEGFFGVGTLAVLMPILQAAASSVTGDMFDVAFAFGLFISNAAIAVSSLGCIFSIAFFNFFGLSITKVMSATSRSTIDAMRTLLVWMFSLAFGWELFQWPQVIGFAVLVFGTFMYNEVFRVPIKSLYPEATLVDDERRNETSPLLAESGTTTAVNGDTYY